MDRLTEGVNEKTIDGCMSELVRLHEAKADMKVQLEELILDQLRKTPGFPVERLDNAHIQLKLDKKGGFAIVNVPVEGLSLDTGVLGNLNKIPGFKASLMELGSIKELEIIVDPSRPSSLGRAVEAVRGDTAAKVTEDL